MNPSEEVDQILGEWRLAHEKGIAGSPDSVIRQHPELAEALRDGFAVMHALDELLAGSRLPPETIPERIGPYHVEQKIGQGGMGTVYRATVEGEVQKLARGDPVAVKVIHAHLMGRQGFFKRFLREAQLGRQVSHDNVVRTLDVDAVQSGAQTLLYLVMEHVEGRTLRELLQDLGVVPEALLREIACQAAAGLEAIHTAGIVHRDLKPENVIITDDHRVRIMDLGVAKVRDGSPAITEEGQFAGSLLYAAPEQIRQREVGCPADLYALGVLLYELGTGRNPFRAAEAAAVMHAHLEEVPLRADEVNPDLSAFLGELIAVLLEKDPGKRPQSATELLGLLETAEASPWWSARERSRDERKVRIPVRRETTLHGRDTELELVCQCWERAREGKGNTLLLEGEAGIGKTRLVDAFVQDLDGHARVLYGSYPPAGGIGGISDAILAEFGSQDLEEALRPHLTVTPALVAPFAAVLKHAAPPEGAPTLAGDAMHAVSVHLMRALAADRPLVWVVEDLHFADADSRILLLSLARAVAGHRVLLLLTTRPGIPDAELAHFSRLATFRRSGLGRLSAREVILLLQDAFRSDALADKLGARIALKSDGIPFFVFEMIRGLREGQFITQLPDGSYVETQEVEQIEVPSAVKDLIEARLRDISDEERAILDVGAVQGFEFDPDLVATARGTDRLFVLERLASVERRSGVVRAVSRNYRFDHHQIQEVLYDHLSPGLKEEYHFLTAEAFAGQLADPPEGESAYFLACHHLRGRCPSEGVPQLTAALAHLEQQYQSAAGIELATLALQAPGLLTNRGRFEVLLCNAKQYDQCGEQSAAHGVLEEALSLADSIGDAALRGRARAAKARFLHRIPDFASSRSFAEESLDLAREARDKRTECAAASLVGAALLAQGDLEGARARFEHALALSHDLDDRRSEVDVTTNLGNLLIAQARFDEAQTMYERSLDLARSIGSRAQEAANLVNLSRMSWARCHREEAMAQVERALDLSREIGFRRIEARSAWMLGSYLATLGRPEDARTHIERQLALTGEIGDRAGEIEGRSNLGNVLSRLGHFEEARQQFESALALARDIEDLRRETLVLGFMGSISLAQGRYEQSRGFLEEAVALMRVGGGRANEGATLANLGALQVLLGQTEVARDTLNESLRVTRESPVGPWAEAHVGASLGSLAVQCGDLEKARQLYEDALELCRGLADTVLVPGILVLLGRVEASTGDEAAAAAHFEEALTLAEEAGDLNTVVLATTERAQLPGGDIAAALTALETHETQIYYGNRIEARFSLWGIARDRTHLSKAKRLLDGLLDQAPEECRASMVENVPLHRDIMAAWEEHGGEE